MPTAIVQVNISGWVFEEQHERVLGVGRKRLGDRRFGRESFKAVRGFGPRQHRGFLG